MTFDFVFTVTFVTIASISVALAVINYVDGYNDLVVIGLITAALCLIPLFF